MSRSGSRSEGFGALGDGFDEALAAGLQELGLALPAASLAKLRSYVALLLKWNAHVNLTSVVEPPAIAELHLVDSLALLRSLGAARTLLDVGTGAGLPAIPLACAVPGLRVVCCDAVAKKIAFVKAAAAELDLEVTARAVRAGGGPEVDGLPRCDAVVSRAVADPARWLPLGSRYLAEGGSLFAMLGRESHEDGLRRVGWACGLELASVDRFRLPRSGAERAVARYWR